MHVCQQGLGSSSRIRAYIHTYIHTSVLLHLAAGWGPALRPLILWQVDGVGRETEGGAGLLRSNTHQ